MNKAKWDRLERWAKIALVEKRVMNGVWRNDLPNYTTDRNACALVLDELEKRGLMNEWWQCLVPLLDIPLIEWVALRTDPDTICYCAVKVVENG